MDNEKEYGKKGTENGSPWENEIIDVLQSIEEDYSQFTKNFVTLRKNIQGFMEETEEKLKVIQEDTFRKTEAKEVEKDVGAAKKHLGDVDKKLHNVMDEIGFGESLDVSKIPPMILENVYESTLEDIIQTMKRNLGSHDADETIRDALELMRTRTSGSELFQYDGRRIRVRNLVSSIEQKLISAKQVHSTYTELLSKLSEKLPHYEPKNFRAMMKSKSLEFAIDRVTKLMDKIDRMETTLTNTTNIVSSFTNQLNLKMGGLEERITHIEEDLESIVDERFLQYETRIEEMEATMASLTSLKDDMVENKRFEDEVSVLESRIGELSAMLDMEFSDFEDNDATPIDEGEVILGLTDEEKFIYYSIPDGGGTINKIEEGLGDVVDDVEEGLRSLIEKGKIEEIKRGRWTVYERPHECGPQEELKEDDTVEIEDDDSAQDALEFINSEVEELERENDAPADEITTDEETVGSDEDEKTIEESILDLIPEEGCTLSRLNREIEALDKGDIEVLLNELIDNDKLKTIKRNRWTIYMKTEDNLEVK